MYNINKTKLITYMLKNFGVIVSLEGVTIVKIILFAFNKHL